MTSAPPASSEKAFAIFSNTYQPQFLQDVELAHWTSSVLNQPWVDTQLMELMPIGKEEL